MHLIDVPVGNSGEEIIDFSKFKFVGEKYWKSTYF